MNSDQMNDFSHIWDFITETSVTADVDTGHTINHNNNGDYSFNFMNASSTNAKQMVNNNGSLLPGVDVTLSQSDFNSILFDNTLDDGKGHSNHNPLSFLNFDADANNNNNNRKNSAQNNIDDFLMDFRQPGIEQTVINTDRGT